jgi:hypothetical protein
MKNLIVASCLIALTNCSLFKVEGLGTGSPNQASTGSSTAGASPGATKWLTEADAAFPTWWAEIEPLSSQLTKEVQTIKASSGNHYEKTEALRALWTKTASNAAAKKPENVYLLQFPIAAAAAEIHRAAKVEFATYPFMVSLGIDTGFTKHGRALGSKEEEHDRFLLGASKGEYSSLGIRYLTSEDLTDSFPLPKARRQELEAAREAGTKVATALYEKPSEEGQRSIDAGPTVGATVWINSEGDGANVAHGSTEKKVTAVSSTGFTLVGAKIASEPYNCKSVVGTSGGVPDVIQDCSYKRVETKITITVATNAVPLKLEVGDRVDLQGKLSEYNRDQAKKTINAKIEDAFISKVVRNKAVVFGSK